MLHAAEFRRRFLLLILLTWTVPPVFGLSFIIFIGVLSPEQVFSILLTPLEPAYIFGWLAFALWYFPRYVRPLSAWLAQPDPDQTDTVIERMRGFALRFWGIFLVYLLLAPSSVILSAEYYADYVAQPLDWFRIHLVALIVSIIVGLPIFFLILDLFGRVLGDLPFQRPHVTIKTKVFLVGALIPLLIDTMLVQYYWTRTGFFSMETFFVWLLLELLAIAGSLIFVRSLGQSLAPLQGMIEAGPDSGSREFSRLRPLSTDEMGVLATGYRRLLHDLHIHNEILELNNRLLRSAGAVSHLPELLDAVVELCQEAIGGERVFLILRDENADELVGVAQTGLPYKPEGYFRLALDEVSTAVWVYRHGQTLAIDDAHGDVRVSERMRARFKVRSALAAPLIQEGEAIGVLMSVASRRARHYEDHERLLIEGLAREAALAINAVRTNIRRREAEQALRRHRERLEQRVVERTAELSALNRELEAFSYSVSHDLRGPLRAIDGFSQAVIEDYGDRLHEEGVEYLQRVRKAAQRMGELIDDLLDMSRVTRSELRSEPVDLSALAAEIAEELQKREPERDVAVSIAPGLHVRGDPQLLRIALENLLGNAWKYTGRAADARIEFGTEEKVNGETVYYVRDNGAGFDMRFAGRLFKPFERLHGVSEFPGTGIGLATVQRIVQRHGGRVWADAQEGKGARFSFTLSGAWPPSPPHPP